MFSDFLSACASGVEIREKKVTGHIFTNLLSLLSPQRATMVGAEGRIFTFYPSRSSENAFLALKKKAKSFQDSSLLGFGRNNIKLNNFQRIKCYASSFTSHPSPSVFLSSKCLFFSTIHAWQPYLKSDQFNFTVAESICLPKTCSKSEKMLE